MPELTSPAYIRELMQRHGFRHRKSLGQNFLADGNIIKKIVDTAGVAPEDLVVEIGPGLGALTRELSRRAGAVIALEIDKALIPVLEETLGDCRNVSLLNADALEADLDRVAGEFTGGLFGESGRKYKLVANLPYYITTPILMNVLTRKFNLETLVVMIQLEVASRLAASPGGKEYGSLSVAVQYYTRPELVFRVPGSVFIPRPAVDSAVVRLTRRDHPPVEVPDEDCFFKIVRGAFGQRRKTLLNALCGAGLGPDKQSWEEMLKQAAIEPGRRGETLGLEEFAAITSVYCKNL